jgi:predicted GIY-YIG superfamily endonuclease
MAAHATKSLYVLACRHDTWYVGVTQDMDARWAEHAGGVAAGGASWTDAHAPLRVESCVAVASAAAAGEESKLTAGLMLERGVNCVRGAAYCHKRMYTIDDSDGLSGFIGHALGRNYGSVAAAIRSDLEAAGARETEATRGSGGGARRAAAAPAAGGAHGGGRGGACARCGRNSHREGACYAGTHLSGAPLAPKRGGAEEEESSSSSGSDDIDDSESSSSDDEEEEETCHRCGRPGHWAQQCYARRRVDGAAL